MYVCVGACVCVCGEARRERERKRERYIARAGQWGSRIVGQGRFRTFFIGGVHFPFSLILHDGKYRAPRTWSHGERY